MSLLVVQVLHEGIIFGSYKNINRTKSLYRTQSQQKGVNILLWPNNKAIIGTVGVTSFFNCSIEKWLDGFIKENVLFDSFENLANKLKIEVEKERSLCDGINNPPLGLIIYLAGFEIKENIKVPTLWIITNIHDYNHKLGHGYTDIRKEFLIKEELWDSENFKNNKPTPQTIRNDLQKLEKNFTPIFFHQGFDLDIFTNLKDFLKGSLELLIKKTSNHKFPESIEEWEKNLRMKILIYEAYLEAFYDTTKQYMGGEVDIKSLSWE